MEWPIQNMYFLGWGGGVFERKTFRDYRSSEVRIEYA